MPARAARRPARDPAAAAAAGAGSAQLELTFEAPPPEAHGLAAPAADPRTVELPPGARWREVVADGQRIRFVLQRSRRRTIGFMIADDGLRVTAPRWVVLADIDDAVREKSRWILSKLRDWQARKERLALNRTRWENGGELPYLGRRVTLRLDAQRATGLAGDPAAPADGDVLWLALPADAGVARIRDTVQAWLQGQARQVFGARLELFLARTGLRINRWRLSSAATRWGSCTSEGNILLNWRLIHFPLDVIDYVVAHELAHLREMNHSADFWAEVGQLLPGFESARDALRRHDPASLPQFR
ncbi:SprT family zinc-dependent metalloprotease [Pigmentiphaga soli]|uniref:SprT family zinc-dependent metalloprotease n=1 Tax=Pigmentiphaga soli TaxID=1007095 RepID=A0ABP8HKZ7_9BURK